jgi:proteasome lid subunit RPN8/RPN11
VTDTSAPATSADRSVRIRGEVADALLAHARTEAPLECCGLLLGAADRVDAAVPARNLLASATRFRVDPRAHFEALGLARERGLAVVGAYHSHPASAPVPSPRDLAEASYPDFLYLIVGLPDRLLRGYRLVEGNFRAVELVRIR